jgi:hypothetical protein
MRKSIQLIALLAIVLGFSSCTSTRPAGAIIEVTSFRTKSGSVGSTAFQKRDSEISRDYTSQQPGFLKRLSGVNEKGEYVVVVYWKTMADAEASMNKFMTDKSVADYAGMIDGPTMKMNRYKMLK